MKTLFLCIGLTICAGWTAATRTPQEEVRKFTFGTPTSAARAGFVKVTAEDVFTPEKGYGFQSGQGLAAYDRGGSEIVLPKDDYTASTYGAYRTTSDLTCAFIEGRSDNGFEAAVPDGQYRVWLVASDAEWDPPFFEVWANGEKKLDVRIPRARFVFMESFQARATDGRLRVEFKGPHGWILNGLVIGKEGSELAEVVAKLERDIFFLTEPELPNWREVKSQPANPPLEWSGAEREKGYVAFPVDYTERIVPTFVPARATIGKPLTAFATPGEFEPVSLCILSRQDLGRVAVEPSDFVMEKGKQAIAKENVKVGVVRCWPQLYFYPIDEPGNNKTANRMLFAENVLGFVHEVPGCKTATTLTAGDVQRLGDLVDARIYAYGHYNRNKVLRETRQGHPFWYYENGIFYGHSAIASRGNMGLEFLRSGAEVATAWGFDATCANPYNDFDGGHKDWNVVFPGVDGPTPTIYWELCREGVDDCRYVATPLDEYYVGETIPWTIRTASANSEIRVTLSAGDELIAEQTHKAEAGSVQGKFESHGLKPGIYTLGAETGASPQAAQRQIIVAPDPWKQ